MKTRNEIYSIQTSRAGISISGIFDGCNSSSTISAGLHTSDSCLVGSWKNTETSIPIHHALRNWITSYVTIITSGLIQKFSQLSTQKDVEDHIQYSEKIELKEREMKDVFSNISKYAICALVSLSVVLGQGTPKLDIHIVDQKVNLTKTEKKDQSQVSYTPGDTIRYVITASNTGSGLMKNPAITDPVPAGVTYVSESASGIDTEITFSMNQGNTYMAWPPYYTVRNSKGILVKREATPEMISHIKWTVMKSLNPGEASTMEFLVVVNK